jgi:hypothetical protein
MAAPASVADRSDMDGLNFVCENDVDADLSSLLLATNPCMKLE